MDEKRLTAEQGSALRTAERARGELLDPERGSEGTLR